MAVFEMVGGKCPPFRTWLARWIRIKRRVDTLSKLRGRLRSGDLPGARRRSVHNDPGYAFQIAVDTALIWLAHQHPATDSRAPDFIATVNTGVVYASGSRIAEHGGAHENDRNVALLISTRCSLRGPYLHWSRLRKRRRPSCARSAMTRTSFRR